jgi:hypothetical protein
MLYTQNSWHLLLGKSLIRSMDDAIPKNIIRKTIKLE